MEATDSTPKTVDRATRWLRWAVAVVLSLVVLGGAAVAALYALSPAAVRQPATTHYHFRIQIIADGKPVNFADSAFQTPLNKDICTAALTNEPMHFHDGIDQFAHVHWTHMTGGLFLKNYGWNLMGGLPGELGFRFDKLPRLTPVPIHGAALPPVPADAHYFIYTGDDQAYTERQWNDFLRQDINSFFGKTQVSAHGSLWDWLVPAVSAHGASEQELTELNHLVGNVVIFAQKTRPTEAQIKARFGLLAPLPETTCGG